MALRFAMWVIVSLIFFVQYGESTRHGIVAKSSSHHGASTSLNHHGGAKGASNNSNGPSWSMPIMRVDQYEDVHSAGLNKSATQRLEEMVQRSRRRPRAHRSEVGTLASRDDLNRIGLIQSQYLMELRIGTPTQTFSAVTMDTGTDLTWVQCFPCHPCKNQLSAPFHPTDSATYNRVDCSSQMCQDLPYNRCDPAPDVKCNYEAQTLEDSDTTTGELIVDLMHFNNDAVADATAAIYFGCGYANTGKSNKNDGVAGFCRSPLGLSYQLSSSLGFDNVFAHCFVRYDSSPHQASTFTIGAAQANGVGYTPMITSPAGEPCLYYVQLTGIKVGKQALRIDPAVFTLDPQGSSGTVIDSGSSLTYLTRVAFDAVVTAVKAQVKLPVFKGTPPLDLELCYDRTGVATDSLVLPDLTFSFPGVDLFVSQQVAFFRFLGNSVCLGMLPADSLGPSSIGNIFMTNTYVVYDNKNTRMGSLQGFNTTSYGKNVVIYTECLHF